MEARIQIRIGNQGYSCKVASPQETMPHAIARVVSEAAMSIARELPAPPPILAPAACCPACGHGLDDAAILSAAGRINAARRKTRGHATPEQLRAAARLGVAARRRKRDASV